MTEQSVSKIERMQLSSDLSESYNRAKNKSVTVSAISIFVSLYELDENKSGVFGFGFKNLTDRGLEWSFWLAALVFAFNAGLRYLEDRKEYRIYGSDIEKFVKEYDSQLARSAQSHAEFGRELKTFPPNILEEYHNVKLQHQEIRDSVPPKDAAATDHTSARMNDLRNQVHRMAEVGKVLGKFLELIPSFVSSKDELRETALRVRYFSKIGRIRFSLIDALFPALLFVTATTFFGSQCSRTFALTLQNFGPW